MAEVVEVIKPIAAKPIPKRSMKRINVFGQIGYLKQLRAARFKKPYALMGMVDWDRTLDHLAGLRPKQIPAVKNFIAAGHATAGMALADRMSIISTVLAGKGRYGGVFKRPHARLSPTELRAKTEAVKAIITG